LSKITILLISIAMTAMSCKPSTVDITGNDQKLNDSAAAGVKSPITWTNCGSSVGEHPCDFTLVDTDGNEVTLYDLYGKAIVVDFSTMWCYYCQVAAADIKGLVDSYNDKDLIYLTILTQNFQGETPTDEDINEWARHFEIGEQLSPVLAGNMSMIDPTGVNGWQVESWPAFYFIDKEMTIVNYLKGYSSYSITQGIESIIN
jgi:cytochrome oxidase Cu insertion factor (SCO1/SenC/PrrC family)